MVDEDQPINLRDAALDQSFNRMIESDNARYGIHGELSMSLEYGINPVPTSSSSGSLSESL